MHITDVPIRRFRRPCVAISAAAAALLAGCDGRRITDPAPPPDVRPYVTGAAAANLGPDGLFSYPIAVAPAAEPIISAARARELAVSYTLSFGPALEERWRQQHGQAFDYRELQADGRVLFQSTPFEMFPDGYHSAFRRTFGPYYLVRLGTEGHHRMSVAVSAYTTDVAILPDGRLNRPSESGAEFFERGFPADSTTDEMAPLWPEAAVVHVARLTGTRVSEVPEFVRMVWNWGPLGGGWKLTLDRAIRVRTLSGSRTTEARELYLGREGGRRLFIPAAEQPAYLEMGALVSGDPDKIELVRLGVLPGQPTVFEEVAVVSQPK
jgi:hypothetical protein